VENYSQLDISVFEPLERKWLCINPWWRRTIRLFISMILSFLVFTVPMLFFIEIKQHALLFLTQFILGTIAFYIVSILLTAVARNRRTLATLYIKLKDFSLRDSLTGLYNDRKFMTEKLECMSTYAKANNESVAIFFADLDDLKEINDNYSHLAGDSAIVATAKRMGNAFRDNDFLFRFGGDEFFAITLLKNTPENEAEEEVAKITQRITDSVSTKPVRYGEDKILLSISIGAHILNPENTIGRELLIVDKKMYAIKKDRKLGGKATRK